jgi:hypothetical protein
MIKRNAYSHTIDFKKIIQQNMSRSIKVHVHWMNLMKNQIMQKFQCLGCAALGGDYNLLSCIKHLFL